ncbi:hypothetical protein MKX75_13135 [Paenibacillus sp. FSL R5-0341]|uniref:hypothetical protein n=1 Tax=Paenibacillus sp. FSL R5-0341 TaxID=2921636 RepID=UPI0030D5B563
MKKKFYLILVLICSVFILGGCNDIDLTKEKDIILKLIESDQWSEAKMNLEKEEFKSIEDYQALYSYVDARNDYINNENGNISYEPIISKLRSIDLDTYNGVLKAEIEGFKDELIEERDKFYKDFYAKQSKEEKESREETIKTHKQEDKIVAKEIKKKVSNLIKNRDYESVLDLIILHTHLDKDIYNLYIFASAQLEREKGDEQSMIDYLELIPMAYEGEYASLISDYKLSIQPKDKWLAAERYISEIREKPIEEKERIMVYLPAIGMTAAEMRISSWGTPKKINKTTYEFGIHEQWVYSDYRYVYLEDGIVTAIQE